MAANSEAEESARWAKNFLISFAQDLGANQVVKVVLTVVLLRIFVRIEGNGKWAKVVKVLMDVVTARAVAMASIQSQYKIQSV